MKYGSKMQLRRSLKKGKKTHGSGSGQGTQNFYQRQSDSGLDGYKRKATGNGIAFGKRKSEASGLGFTKGSIGKSNIKPSSSNELGGSGIASEGNKPHGKKKRRSSKYMNKVMSGKY